MKKILIIVLVLVLVAGMVGALGVVTNGFKKWDLNNAKENAEQWAEESRAQIDALKERIEELREKIEKKDDESDDENGDDQNGGDDQSDDQNSTPSSLADLDGALRGFACNDYVAGIEVDTSVNPAFLDAYLAAFDEDVELVSFDGDAGIAVQEGGLVVFGCGKGLVYAPASKTIEGVTFAKGWTLISDLEEMTVAAYEGEDVYSFAFVLPLRVTAVDGSLGDLNTTVVGESADNALTPFFGASTTLPAFNSGSYVDGIVINCDVDSDVLDAYLNNYSNGITLAEFEGADGSDIEIAITGFEGSDQVLLGIFDEENNSSILYSTSAFAVYGDEDQVVCSIPSGWSFVKVNDDESVFVMQLSGEYRYDFLCPQKLVDADNAFSVLNGRLFGSYVNDDPCYHVFDQGICVRCGLAENCYYGVHNDDGTGLCSDCNVEMYHFDEDEDGLCDHCGDLIDDVEGEIEPMGEDDENE